MGFVADLFVLVGVRLHRARLVLVAIVGGRVKRTSSPNGGYANALEARCSPA